MTERARAPARRPARVRRRRLAPAAHAADRPAAAARGGAAPRATPTRASELDAALARGRPAVGDGRRAARCCREAGEADAPARAGRPRRRRAPRRRALGRRRGSAARVARATARRAAARCARADLDRALDALIENALRYGRRAAVAVAVGARRTIEVLDDGPGSAGTRRRRCSSASTAAAPAAPGRAGTGLGPADRARARARWGGDVTLANRDGGGARAWPSQLLPAA